MVTSSGALALEQRAPVRGCLLVPSPPREAEIHCTQVTATSSNITSRMFPKPSRSAPHRRSMRHRHRVPLYVVVCWLVTSLTPRAKRSRDRNSNQIVTRRRSHFSSILREWSRRRRATIIMSHLTTTTDVSLPVQ